MAINLLRAQNSNQMPPTPTPQLHSGVQGFAPFSAASTVGTSVIGTDLTILGQDITIVSQNRVQIDGDIRGDVAGKQVSIGKEGSVMGAVAAEKVEVHGGVKGAIRAASVVLHASANVDAEILHEILSVEEGAQVQGRLCKPGDARELIPNLDASTYPARGGPHT